MTAVAQSRAAEAFRWSTVRIVALATLCTAQLIESIDVTVVNVALPAMKLDLGLTQASLQWVVSAYTVLFGGFLLLGGRCGDLLGRRRTFMAGVLSFTAASLLCGAAPTGAVLIVGRAVQGLAAAFVAPATLASIAITFPEGAPRNRAMGIWGAVTGISASVGVVAGGLLVDGVGWRWIFFINVPIGLMLLAIAPRSLPHDEPTQSGAGFDAVGAASVTTGMLALVFAAVQSVGYGIGSFRALAPLGIAALSFAFFAAHEGRIATHPLVPRELLRNRSVAAANVVAVLVGSSMLAMFFLISLSQQQVHHLSALQTGVDYLPLTALLMICAFLAGPLVARLGVGGVVALGSGLATVGILLFSLGGSRVFASIIGPSLVVGPGLALTFIPMTSAAVSGVRPDLAGLAAGLANATRTAGGSLGLAVVSALVASRAHALAGERTPAGALGGGISLGFLACAGLMGSAALCALVLFPSRVKGHKAKVA